MVIQKSKTPFTNLSNLENFIFNTVFLIILVYVLAIGYYKQVLIIKELNISAIIILYFFISALFLSRFFSYKNKSALVCDGEDTWNFFKGNKKFRFETNEISFVKKSFWGLYSSFSIVIDRQKIHIPAESKNLAALIQSLSKRLKKEQISDFLQYHQKASFIRFEMEKTANVLKFFCFLIAPIAFFTAVSVWECVSMMICIVWVIFSLIYPLFWTAVNWILLIFSANNFSIFSKVSAVWAFFGVIFYMLLGICYRNFYLWAIYRL
ncbi:MAG: hypothetical protein LBH98_07590 [Chitinispirillales bacterium]|jgi:hypothetical protein|nr:hypothetical protein [Chitinispirillales bacterium]